MSVSISSSQCGMHSKLYTAAEAPRSSEVRCVCSDLEPPAAAPAHHTHTPANTYAQTTPCPLTPTPPLPPWKTIPLHLILVPGLHASSAVNNFWARSQSLSSGAATRSVLSILFYNCNILIFSGQMERGSRPSDMDTDTQTHTHAYTVSAFFISSDVDRCLSVLR